MLENGRPLHTDGRLEKEIAVYDFLDRLSVGYDRVDHEAAMTMELCEEIDQILGATICKNLFLCTRNKSEYYLLMMPGDKVFKTKDLSAQIESSRLSFASAEDMAEILNLTPGSASVMGLMYDLEKRVVLLIDRDILKEEYIGLHPCINTSSLRIKTEDMLQKVIPALEHTVIQVTL